MRRGRQHLAGRGPLVEDEDRLAGADGPGDTSEPIVSRADRPFLFVLTDVPTGAVLFISPVADPPAK